MHIQGIQHTTHPQTPEAGAPARDAAPASADTRATATPAGAATTTGAATTAGADGVPAASGTPGATSASPAVGAGDTDAQEGGERAAPLRVDAQRNLEHVLRAAREVFGELGYGAPMEDVARRARVGVGTVYRRFPSKDVLVRRIAREETERLTEQARAALGQEEEPWSALSRFLRTSVASGAGRLLPPPILRADGWTDRRTDGGTGTSVQAPAQVSADSTAAGTAESTAAGRDAGGQDAVRVPQQRQMHGQGTPDSGGPGSPGQPGLRLVGQRTAPDAERVPQPTAAADRQSDGPDDDSGAAELLGLVGRLVQRARDAGELRADVTIRDVLLVIATSAPSLPDAAQQAAASKRLLDILLEGLRPHATRRANAER